MQLNGNIRQITNRRRALLILAYTFSDTCPQLSTAFGLYNASTPAVKHHSETNKEEGHYISFA